MAALWQQQRPWTTSCSSVRYAGPAQVQAAPVIAQAPIPAAVPATGFVVAPAAPVAAAVTMSQHASEVLSRQRWAAIGLVLVAALILLILMLWVWLKDRCTGDSDCASLCPRADVPCASRCNRGRCEQVPVSCTQPGQAWCPSERACIDTRTRVCGAPGITPVVPPIVPPPPAPVSPVASTISSPATLTQQYQQQQQQQLEQAPLPLPAWGPTDAVNVQQQQYPCANEMARASSPTPGLQVDDVTVATLGLVLLNCAWHSEAGPQTVVVNGVTYVVEPGMSAVRLADDDGRLWECGSGGRWWHMGALDGNQQTLPAPRDAYSDATAVVTVACWDQTVDMVWTNDGYGRVWAAPRKGGTDWSPCDPSTGVSAAGPPPSTPIDATTAAADIAQGRALAAASASALVGGNNMGTR